MAMACQQHADTCPQCRNNGSHWAFEETNAIQQCRALMELYLVWVLQDTTPCTWPMGVLFLSFFPFVMPLTATYCLQFKQ